MCSDLDQHRRRVETRAPDIPLQLLPTWSEVLARDYRPWQGAPLVIDTARLGVDECVQSLVPAMRQA